MSKMAEYSSFIDQVRLSFISKTGLDPEKALKINMSEDLIHDYTRNESVRSCVKILISDYQTINNKTI